jgi:hypothetical protein
VLGLKPSSTTFEFKVNNQAEAIRHTVKNADRTGEIWWPNTEWIYNSAA